MSLKKYATALTLALCAVAFTNIIPPHRGVTAEEGDPSLPAEDPVPVELNKDKAELFLPETYEQYLPLESPASFSFGENGEIAVADGKSIYYYDPEIGEYICYNHTHQINNVQFYNGTLYFSANGTFFYKFNPDPISPSANIYMNLACSTFLLADGLLFAESKSLSPSTVSLTCIREETLNQPDFDGAKMLPFIVRNSSEDVYLATYADGILYAATDINAHAYDLTAYLESGNADDVSITTSQLNNRVDSISLSSTAIYRDKFYYTVKSDNDKAGLYTSDLQGNAEQLISAKNLSALTVQNDKFYCVYGKTVRELSVSEEGGIAYSGYEIGASSDSPHRLAGTSETVRTKNLVVFADRDNKRVTIYNRQNKDYGKCYTVIDCVDGNGDPFVPEHVAIDKVEEKILKNGKTLYSNKIAVSSGNKIFMYTYSRYPDHNGEDSVTSSLPKNVSQAASVSVVGMTFVYGECYYITQHNVYGAYSDPNTTEYHFNITSGETPNYIASDMYGNLYVAFMSHVAVFEESEFWSDGAEENEYYTLQASPVSFSVDYEGNAWYLTDDGKLYCNDEDEERANIDGKNFVCLKNAHDYPVSFALAFEDDEVYFCFGNYVVKTIPFMLDSLVSLNKIKAGESKEGAFKLRGLSELFVDVPAGEIGIRINLDELKKDDIVYFPYEGYFRTEAPARGVLLHKGQADNGFYVVALYDEETRSFSANIFKKSQSRLTLNEEFTSAADDYRYIASGVALCSAPCLFSSPKNELPALATQALLRGARVHVLGYATGVDREYALVEVLENERSYEMGYVPVSFLSKTDPLGVLVKEYTLGYLKGGTGVVLVSDDGKELSVDERMQAKFYANEDGTYTAVVVKDGVKYSGIVKSDDISYGETDALRISLIVILSVLTLVIICGYLFLMFPRKKKKLGKL